MMNGYRERRRTLTGLCAAITFVLAASASAFASMPVAPAAAATTVSASGASTAAPSAGAASGWSDLSAPTQNVPTAQLKALSCPTANWCMSVGSYVGSQGVGRPVSETWNGTTWKIIPAVSAPGSIGSHLLGVSCTSPQACIAVGYSVHFGQPELLNFINHTFAEKWNGTAWTAITPPSFGLPATRDTVLTSVSCATATACTAVGSFALQTGPQTPNGAGLLVVWNGKEWSRSSVPTPKNSSVVLQSVSCTPGNACFAAGSYTTTGKPDLPFVVSRPRASAAWHYRTPTAPFPTTAAANKAGKDFDLAATSISCPQATACTLVGSWRHEGTGVTDFNVYSESWNGTRWQLITMVNPQPQSELDSVSCTAATSCLAIGSTGNGETNLTLAERRTGSHWALVSGPASPAGQGDRSLSCRSTTSCLTVGSDQGTPGQASRLAGQTWSNVTAPSPVGTVQDSLLDVSCPAAGACTAVGHYQAPAGQRVLIESSHAGQWSLSSAPSPSGFTSELDEVSCGSTTSCVGVGFVRPTASSQVSTPLSEVWDGASWSIKPVPAAAPNSGTTLTDVSCASASFCVAVGVAQENSGSTSQQVIEQWDGSQWHIAAGAAPSGTTQSELDTVSCSSATSCLAIGTSQAGSAAQQPLVETLGSSGWTVRSHAGVPGDTQRVSCTSASSCVAVGGSNESDAPKPAASSWNGTAWKALTVPLPSPNEGTATLNDVSCTSPTACTAVGSNPFAVSQAEGPDSDDHPFAATWNGISWQVTNLPVAGGTLGSTLTGISCTTASACVAAGTTSTADSQQIPVLEQHS